MQPMLAGPHNCDYITVTRYGSTDSYGKTKTRIGTPIQDARMLPDVPEIDLNRFPRFQ
jgi:hypothetical protein